MMIRICREKIRGCRGLLLRVALYDIFHRTAVIPKAATPRAIMAWNIRPSTDRFAIAVFALAVLLPTLLDAPEALPVVVPGIELLVPGVASGVTPPGEEEIAMTNDDAVVSTDEADETDETDDVAVSTVPVRVAEVAPPVGGGLALAAFTS